MVGSFWGCLCGVSHGLPVESRLLMTTMDDGEPTPTYESAYLLSTTYGSIFKEYLGWTHGATIF